MSAKNTSDEQRSKWQRDLSKRKLNLEELKLLLEETKQDSRLADVKWCHEQKQGNEEEKELVKKIEQQLFRNNDEFRRFPSDFLHCKIAYDIYRNYLKEGEIAKLDDKNNEWKVVRVFCEPAKLDTKSSNGPLYYAAIYANEREKQMVLAHRGIDVDNIASLFDRNGVIKNQIDGIILKELIPQLAICFKYTEEANQLAKTMGDYYLSFTGYCNGAWLSEYSLYFTHRYFHNQNSRAVLFENPGIIKDIEQFDSTIISNETKFNFYNR